jgi:hypothetical protein
MRVVRCGRYMFAVQVACGLWWKTCVMPIPRACSFGFFLMSLLMKLSLLSKLFFAISSFRVLSHCSSAPVCLFRPKEDDVISVTSSTQSASLVISNLVPLYKLIPGFRFRINITGIPIKHQTLFRIVRLCYCIQYIFSTHLHIQHIYIRDLLWSPYLHSSTRGFPKVSWKQPDRW